MAYIKTIWIDKNHPDFDLLTSPELDANNLNNIEAGIAGAFSAIDNLSTAYGKVTSSTQQAIQTSDTDATWEIYRDSPEPSLFAFNDTNDTITFNQAGTFNITAGTTFGIESDITTLITAKMVDIATSDVVQSDTTTVDTGVGTTKSILVTKDITVLSSDLPMTLKIVHIADGANIYLNNINYTVNTFVAGAIIHSNLTGTSAADCHPITAITNLEETLQGVGSPLSGEIA